MRDTLFGQEVFIFDVESIGLHGEAFSVAGGIYPTQVDAKDLKGVISGRDEFHFAIDRGSVCGDAYDRAWVDNNVPDAAPGYMCSTALELRKKFWDQMCSAKDAADDPLFIAADCCWPVEANFLSRCVVDHIEGRKFTGPYPLLDISTVAAIVGFDEFSDVPRNDREILHHPLWDVRYSARKLAHCLALLRTK